MNEAVGDVGERVHQDGAEEHRETSAPVSERAPEHAPHKHADHLKVDQPHADAKHIRLSNTDALKAGCAHDAEEDQVVDVDEVAKCRNDDGEDNSAIGFRRGGHAHERDLYSKRAFFGHVSIKARGNGGRLRAAELVQNEVVRPLN